MKPGCPVRTTISLSIRRAAMFPVKDIPTLWIVLVARTSGRRGRAPSKSSPVRQFLPRCNRPAAVQNPDLNYLPMFALSDKLPQWVSDAETTIIMDATDSALKLWRYKRADFVGRPATDLLCTEEVPKSERLRRINLWGQTGPWRCRRGDGSEFFMSVRWQQLTYKGTLCNYVFPVEIGESLDSMRKIVNKGMPKAPASHKPRAPEIPSRQALSRN